MIENVIQPHRDDANLQDYDTACSRFTWDDANREFSWSTTRKCNIAHEAIDRHAEAPGRALRRCVIYHHKSQRRDITYEQMRALSNRFGNVLRKAGIAKGDRVFLFMPRIPELYIALAGCAKIGAVIAPLYSDFRADAVKERMLDGRGKLLVTTPWHRARVPFDELPDLEHCIIAGGEPWDLRAGDLSWDREMAAAPEELEPEWVPRDFPLLLVYTSGKDGRPVGLLHSHDAMRGYLVTARWVLDLRDDDVLCTLARPGWLMNIVYSAFAPWLCGVESFITGTMNTADDLYRLISGHGVSVLYTIPTVYRMLVAAGEGAAQKFPRKRLRHLLSVLEPLFPDLFYAAMRVLGLPVYNTWWSAETGMITIAQLPCLGIKPGSLGKPLPGITAAIIDSAGREVPPFHTGSLALQSGWPAMTAGIWKNKTLYQQYTRMQPWFMTGDTAYVDHDNYFYHQGRCDDVLITSSGRIGMAEIANILGTHPAVAEAAVIRVADEGGARKLKAFIALKADYRPSRLIRGKIISYVSNRLSPADVPQDIRFCKQLPKDNDGRILGIVLKAWERGIPAGRYAPWTDA